MRGARPPRVECENEPQALPRANANPGAECEASGRVGLSDFAATPHSDNPGQKRNARYRNASSKNVAAVKLNQARTVGA